MIGQPVQAGRRDYIHECMKDLSNKLAERAARKTRKRDEKRQQIAASAVEALTQLGYANTSMRDIASLSDMSLGMLTYYFGEKSDLIIYCVTLYKSDFVRANEAAISVSGDRDTVLDTFATGIAHTIKTDAASHRLWYDIRAQAMFDETFRPTVNEIEISLIEMIGLLRDRLGLAHPADVDTDYAALDGLFRFWIQDQERPARATEKQIKESFLKLFSQLWPSH